MDLKSKLGIYKRENSVKNESQKNNQELFDYGGEKINFEGFEIWRFESRLSNFNQYNEALRAGNSNLQSLLSFSKIDSNYKLHDLIFFDVETTSLSTGTGNYPFVCGIGFCDDDDFIVEQLFMEEYSDERAILEYMIEIFQNAKAVVTFNGNSFDLPLIKNRYMINRVYDFPVEIPSFDLITPSRRIFRSLFENCQLQTLEKNVLGFERVDDIPGWQVPDIYFNYQKSGNAHDIPGVIEHNMYDIFSMYVLIQILAEIFQNLNSGNYEKIEKKSLLSLAKHLYKQSPDLFLDVARYLGDCIFEDKGVFERFSIILKRNSEWERAINYWKNDESIFSFVELAKYYEHKEGSFDKALEYCFKALEIEIDSKIQEALNKRIERLKRKKNR
jgi:uncharacterized protein YprB with RNaseH-like and TPR domain